jgi:hypothetical protein
MKLDLKTVWEWIGIYKLRLSQLCNHHSDWQPVNQTAVDQMWPDDYWAVEHTRNRFPWRVSLQKVWSLPWAQPSHLTLVKTKHNHINLGCEEDLNVTEPQSPALCYGVMRVGPLATRWILRLQSPGWATTTSQFWWRDGGIAFSQ